VRDEAEIRGHRRTYVGAMPGRIIQALKQAGANNPVVLLDEVDKLGSDVRGDPSAALLEVLDPEQNHTFRDHYLGVNFDLSKILFIATANLPETIPPPLRDRMETLRLSGYSEEEKLVIAERYLVPKQVTEAGLTINEIVVGRDVVRRIVGEYTRESGLRELERLIAQLARKVARRVVEQAAARDRPAAQGAPLGKDAAGAAPARKPSGPAISAEELPTFLGPPRFLPEERRGADEIGTVNGLAWTPYGGEVLHIEAQTMAGKGTLILTGQLGDVMKESAQAALSFIRSRARWLGLEENFLEKTDIHVHIPAGAIPKDGPSAGVTMFVAMASLLTGKPIRNDVAMTGEITLRGLVLPVGGIKEKFLAAHRAGIKRVILPERNRKDIIEIPDQPKKEIEILFVKRMDELLPLVLTEMPKLGVMTVPAMTPPSAAPPPAA
jgi:ATP-dependent Lon protease